MTAGDFFSWLPDDIVISILCQLSSSASSPSDLVGILMTCKRLNGLGQNPLILSRTSLKSLAIKAKNWSEQAHRFLRRCADAGNLEACYILGMITFYCLQNCRGGVCLMSRAAVKKHSGALYSLAIIYFNTSGDHWKKKNPLAGTAFLICSAALKHADAIRTLGYCYLDGYGVVKNIARGQGLLRHAYAQELASVSDFRCNVPVIESHPANRFLVEWFVLNPVGVELRMCSRRACGRPETRKHEFGPCPVCEKVSYCSIACQTRHWKLRHKGECAPLDQELLLHGGGGGGGDGAV